MGNQVKESEEKKHGKGDKSRKDYYDTVIVPRYEGIFEGNLMKTYLLAYMKNLDNEFGPIRSDGSITWGR